MSDTFTEVQEMIAEHLGQDPSAITLESRFEEDLGADSLDAAEVVMKSEEAFNVEIPDEASENLRTVADLVAFIDKAKA